MPVRYHKDLWVPTQMVAEIRLPMRSPMEMIFSLIRFKVNTDYKGNGTAEELLRHAIRGAPG